MDPELQALLDKTKRGGGTWGSANAEKLKATSGLGAAVYGAGTSATFGLLPHILGAPKAEDAGMIPFPADTSARIGEPPVLPFTSGDYADAISMSRRDFPKSFAGGAVAGSLPAGIAASTGLAGAVPALGRATLPSLIGNAATVGAAQGGAEAAGRYASGIDKEPAIVRDALFGAGAGLAGGTLARYLPPIAAFTGQAGRDFAGRMKVSRMRPEMGADEASAFREAGKAADDIGVPMSAGHTMELAGVRATADPALEAAGITPRPSAWIDQGRTLFDDTVNIGNTVKGGSNKVQSADEAFKQGAATSNENAQAALGEAEAAQRAAQEAYTMPFSDDAGRISGSIAKDDVGYKARPIYAIGNRGSELLNEFNEGYKQAFQGMPAKDVPTQLNSPIILAQVRDVLRQELTQLRTMPPSRATKSQIADREAGLQGIEGLIEKSKAGALNTQTVEPPSPPILPDLPDLRAARGAATTAEQISPIAERLLPPMVDPTALPKNGANGVWKDPANWAAGGASLGFGAAGALSGNPMAAAVGVGVPLAARAAYGGIKGAGRVLDRQGGAEALDILLHNPAKAAELFGSRSTGGQGVPSVVTMQMLQNLLPFMGDIPGLKQFQNKGR